MALAVGDDIAGQGGNRLGQLDGRPAQLQTNVVGVDVDLLDAHPADRRGALGVEQHQQGGEPVLGVEVLVVQKPARGVPAVLVIQQLGGAAPADGGEASGGELVGACPPDEVAGLEAVDTRVVAAPTVEIGLRARAQGEVVRLEPVHERDGCACVAADAQRLLARSGPTVVAAAQPPQQMPDRVAVQDLAADRVRLAGAEAGQEPLEANEFLVALGQGTDGDEGLAQMGQGLALAPLVERGRTCEAPRGQPGVSDLVVVVADAGMHSAASLGSRMPGSASSSAPGSASGVTALDLKPIYHSVDELLYMMARFAADVMPATA